MPGACAPSTSVSTPRSRSSRHQARDREDERGRARHVVEERQPRARRDRRQHALDERRRRRRAGTGSRPSPRAPRSGAPRTQRLAAGARRRGRWSGSRRPAASGSAAQHGVDARGGVRHEREVLGPRAEERGDLGARAPPSRPFQRARQEVHRLALELERAAPTAARGSRAGRRRTSRGSGSRPPGRASSATRTGKCPCAAIVHRTAPERHLPPKQRLARTPPAPQAHVAARQRRDVLQERDVVARFLVGEVGPAEQRLDHVRPTNSR